MIGQTASGAARVVVIDPVRMLQLRSEVHCCYDSDRAGGAQVDGVQSRFGGDRPGLAEGAGFGSGCGEGCDGGADEGGAW